MPRPIISTGRLKPRRSVFDLSYRKAFTCDMGQLIPVMIDEVVPGDTVTLGVQEVIRFQPPAAPVMHEISATTHYFFVPYRILWDDDKHANWENYISQAQKSGETPLDYVLPRMNPTQSVAGVNIGLGSLWDYFGFPIRPVTDSNPSTIWPMDMPYRAYWRCVNEYYIDQDLDRRFNNNGESVLPLNELDSFIETPNDPVDGSRFIEIRNGVVHNGWMPFNRRWKKDYFTCARPFRQKGQTPALPVNVSLDGLQFQYTPEGVAQYAELKGDWAAGANFAGQTQVPVQMGRSKPSPNTNTNCYLMSNPNLSSVGLSYADLQLPTIAGSASGFLNYSSHFGVLNDDVGNILAPNLSAAGNAHATTFNVSDLRLAFQTQKWLERNARAGTRYTEFLRSHFGVSPSDSRLNRPEYIGGAKLPIFISEVLQTSESGNNQPLGQLGGHGLAADSQYVGKYNVQEFGVIIGLFSVLPKPGYQDGINRQWLRKFPTDFYFPEFAHLSEQMIQQAEIFHSLGNDGYDDTAPFGYTGQYDEMRIKHDMVCNEMRLTDQRLLSYWNLVRKFNEPPKLNSEFIECNPIEQRRIMLAQNVPALIVNVRNDIKAVRPLPIIAEPGLVDHF